MLKINHISRAGTVGIFLWKNLTSLKRLKFHMHVSDDDSNMFCKFYEIWWNLKKCWNFMIFQRAGTVGIFLWNNSTSLNRLKFNMHVSDDDSNMFCKFVESWWTLKKCWNFMIFLGRALSAFFYELSQPLWMGSQFTCMFLMMIPICSASLMKFGDLKKCWKSIIFLGLHCQYFSVKKFNFSEKAQISHACFWWWFQYVLQVWWNLMNFEKMLKFHDISKGQHCRHFSMKLVNFSEWPQISHACFWWWFKYVLQVWGNLVNFEKMLKFHDISRAGTVDIFLWNKLTSLNGLKFHMHVSDDDSNKFCKFDEI